MNCAAVQVILSAAQEAAAESHSGCMPSVQRVLIGHSLGGAVVAEAVIAAPQARSHVHALDCGLAEHVCGRRACPWGAFTAAAN